MSCKICEIEFPTELGKCDIIVPDSDSDIAHFVLKNDNVEIKIKTFEPEYFGENDYILNEKEKEVLNEKINDIDYILPPEIITWEQTGTYWQWIASMWEEVNEDSNYEQKETVLDKEITPNYLEL